MEEYDIYHHGVKGMKWGVRRFQNEDGSLTDAGKKRLASSIEKAARDTSSEGRNQLHKNLYDDLSNNYQDQLHGHINNIKSKKKRWEELADLEDEYWESDSYDRTTNAAYKQTLDWYKKNDTQYLNEIIKLNNGSEDGLDGFHGFRKTFEGYHDEALTKDRAKWMKERNVDPNASDKAYDDYINSCKAACDSILGNYGNTKVSKVNYWESDRRVNDIVLNVIKDIEKNS